jgi:AraC-like DNA-binding protein/DNA-binding LacI/PurR family transcriptional regulator
MRRTRKIAMVGREWNRVHARLLAGGLHFASGHPSLNVVIQPFNKTVSLGRLASSIERWGADGIYGLFSEDMVHGLKAALSHPIPIVSNCALAQNSAVVQVLGDAQILVEKGVEHLRHLGIKAFGLLWTEPPPAPDSRWLPNFTKLTEPHGSVLSLPTAEDSLMAPDRNTQPVPAPLATWLRALPKPCGVLCPSHGAGRFLVECCGRLGLQVPREIAIIGTDDADVSLSCSPTVTSILNNHEMRGSESVRILLDILDGKPPSAPKIRIRAFDFVVRESTGQHPPMICDVAGALEYIQANATNALTVPQLVRATQRSSETLFYQAFKQATGKTPMQAIRDRQLEEVRRLLATTQLPVGVVSAMAGFSSNSVMGRMFQDVEGTTPLEYRRRENKSKAGEATPAEAREAACTE